MKPGYLRTSCSPTQAANFPIPEKTEKKLQIHNRKELARGACNHSKKGLRKSHGIGSYFKCLIEEDII